MKITVNDIKIDVAFRNKEYNLELKQKMLKFSKRTLAYFVVILGVFLISLRNITFLKLDKEQLILCFSLAAQVCAGLFGGSLIGYMIYADRVKEIILKEEASSSEVCHRRQVLSDLFSKISIVSLSLILISIINFVTVNFENSKLVLFLNNISVLLFLVNIFLLFRFVFLIKDAYKETKAILYTNPMVVKNQEE